MPASTIQLFLLMTLENLITSINIKYLICPYQPIYLIIWEVLCRGGRRVAHMSGMFGNSQTLAWCTSQKYGVTHASANVLIIWQGSSAKVMSSPVYANLCLSFSNGPFSFMAMLMLNVKTISERTVGVLPFRLSMNALKLLDLKGERLRPCLLHSNF
jgi:hypothetical protein